ncbi:Creatinase/aminopeptidase [Paxillus ammoniavirescens]|nr:Creatinase/aminopeptidase [Paxillus ammoniavirescens]
MGNTEPLIPASSNHPHALKAVAIPQNFRLSKLGVLFFVLITIAGFLSTHSLPSFGATSPTFSLDNPWKEFAAHCEAAQPILASEFLQRQHRLALALHKLNASAYIAEPGANALFFGNISDASWHLSERPLLLMVSPLVRDGEVSAQVTILTPYFEETRAKLLSVPGVDLTYVAWQEDEDPYTIGVNALPISSGGAVYVDGMIRHFIVDGLAKAAPEVQVLSAPLEITSLRERKSHAEIALLKCVNEVTVLAIRAVQAQLYIGIRESQVMEMVDDALAAAGLTERWALVLFGENAALPHGTGTDRLLGISDLILIDAGGVLFGYHSDVTRTFQLEESQIPGDHYELWWDVHAAQTAAQRTAKAGIITAEVDKAARAELSGRGLGPYFTHRLGHGIGLEDHEAPYLRGGSDAVIQTGHVFSNEPGVYIEGKAGIRLEDCFYIGGDGQPIYLTAGVGGQAVDPLHP